jgi:hypothetical protein
VSLAKHALERGCFENARSLLESGLHGLGKIRAALKGEDSQ